jgi:hypothetical protein
VLPEVVTKKARTLNPVEYDALVTCHCDPGPVPALGRDRHALGPAHRPAAAPHRPPNRVREVEKTIIDVSRRHSPTGERYVTKHYPKDNEPRAFGVDDGWLEAVGLHISTSDIGRDQPLFSTAAGTPIFRNTFRIRVSLPAVKASGVDFGVRMHDYADLFVMPTSVRNPLLHGVIAA